MHSCLFSIVQPSVGKALFQTRAVAPSVSCSIRGACCIIQQQAAGQAASALLRRLWLRADNWPGSQPSLVWAVGTRRAARPCSIAAGRHHLRHPAVAGPSVAGSLIEILNWRLLSPELRWPSGSSELPDDRHSTLICSSLPWLKKLWLLCHARLHLDTLPGDEYLLAFCLSYDLTSSSHAAMPYRADVIGPPGSTSKYVIVGV